MKRSVKVAFSGIVAALSTAMMFITALIPFGTYAFPTVAGAALVILVIEIGYPYAFSAYAAVSIISLLLLPDKEAAVYYLTFFGCYPIIKSFIERISIRSVQFIIKLLIFNAAMISAFFISVTLFSIPKESFTVFGIYLPWAFLIFGNVLFVFYDICVTKFVTIYLKKWHSRFISNTKL